MRENIILEGKFVRLEEICPKYFAKVIEWRNNPENNRFLNQPFKLTMELEEKWYREKYLNDYTQGLLIAVDKEKISLLLLLDGLIMIGKRKFV